jgi:hypothetical protein
LFAQVEPPFVVTTMTPAPDFVPPTATQSVVEAQETPSRRAMPDGADFFVQVAPPLVVTAIAPVFDVVPPTATQSRLEAQEIPKN